MFMPSGDTPCAKNPDLFYSDILLDTKEAKKMCKQCPYISECAEAGLDEDFGVWGGLSVYERTRLRRGRRFSLRVA